MSFGAKESAPCPSNVGYTNIFCTMENDKNPRLLILCTQPYNPMNQARSLESYFHAFDRENVFQVFSDARTPVKGLCASLYQITDYQLLQRRLRKDAIVGRVFSYEDSLQQSLNETTPLEEAKRFKSDGLYRFARKWVWKKRFWDTSAFQKWISEVAKPDAVFLCFSPDFFLFDLYDEIKRLTNAPLFLSITDDLVFNRHFSLSPFYWAYRFLYEKRAKKAIAESRACFFVSEKMKRFYGERLGAKGYVQYIATRLPTPSQNPIPSCPKVARYFGIIESGRFESLCQVADAFQAAGLETILEVYTPSFDEIAKKKHPDNLLIKKSIPYGRVLSTMRETDLLIMVEGLKKRDQAAVAYSLSTKVADSLGSGRLVLAYGGENAGLISFVKEKDACLVATDFEGLVSLLKKMKDGNICYKEVIERSLLVAEECFDIETQSHLFLSRVRELL